jgi:hypothetical protein
MLDLPCFEVAACLSHVLHKAFTVLHCRLPVRSLQTYEVWQKSNETDFEVKNSLGALCKNFLCIKLD